MRVAGSRDARSGSLPAVGFYSIGGTPEKLRDYLGENIKRWSEVVKNARIAAN